MMAFDMTAELAPILQSMVALLAIASAAIAANAFGPTVIARITHFTLRNKTRISTHGTIVPASV